MAMIKWAKNPNKSARDSISALNSLRMSLNRSLNDASSQGGIHPQANTERQDDLSGASGDPAAPPLVLRQDGIYRRSGWGPAACHRTSLSDHSRMQAQDRSRTRPRLPRV